MQAQREARGGRRRAQASAERAEDGGGRARVETRHHGRVQQPQPRQRADSGGERRRVRRVAADVPEAQLLERRAGAREAPQKRGDVGALRLLVNGRDVHALQAAQPRRRGERQRGVWVVPQRPQLGAAAVDKVVARRAAHEAQRADCVPRQHVADEIAGRF